MAQAALTAIDYDTGGGRYRRFYATITGAASYDAGGDTGVKELLGISEVKQLIASPLTAASQDYDLVWDDTNEKVLWATEGSEAAGDLSTLSFAITVIGI